MLVDPSTGMPISITQPGSFASGLAGDFGMNADTNPGLLSALSKSPSAPTMVGWNAFRGGNTILRGGWSRNELNKGKLLRNQFAPRSFGRLSSIYGVDNSNAPQIGHRFGLRKGTRRPYSPFNILGEDEGLVNFNRPMNWLMKRRNPEAESQRFFSKGLMSRQNAAQRIAGGRTTYEASDVIGNISKLDPSLGAWAAPNAAVLDNAGLSHMVGASMEGTISQRVSGYMMGARIGGPDVAARSILEGAGKSAYLEGADRAVGGLAKGGLERVGKKLVFHAGEEGVEKFGMAAARAGISEGASFAAEAGSSAVLGGLETAGVVAAGTLGMFTGVTELALAAKAVYDVSKMVTGAATSLAKDAKDAVVSFKGDIGKPIMGMGYKDNSVAATSRARGVMSIQNSRLNARSVLGSEASAVFAHFG